MKTKRLPALLLCLAAATAANAADLLPPDQAFQFTAEQTADGRIQARWQIADNYYMYRDKMAFAIAGGNLSAPPELPPGALHWDSLFGEVEVYFSKLEVPLAVAVGGDYSVLATGQGCSVEVGVCYPAITRAVDFSPGAGASDAADDGANAANAGQLMSQIDAVLQSKDQGADGLSAGEKLRALLGVDYAPAEFLEVDDAFRLAVAAAGPERPNRINAAFQIADDYYLYRDKIAFSIEGAARLAAVELPPGKIKDDPYFGQTAILTRDFAAQVTLQRSGPAAAPIRVHATYQGCADGGICYAPVRKTFALELPQVTAAAFADGVSFSDGAAFPGAGAGQAPARAAWPGLMAGAFAAGLLLTFTPCVLPMLPILSGIIVGGGGGTGNGRSARANQIRGGVLALSYVAGSVAAYAAIGAVAGATGEQLQAYFQNLWAIGILSAILLAMALSMFGLFTVQMPAFIQDRWHDRARRLGGTLPLVFALGAVSAVIVGACVSPILISFLGLAVAAGDAALGAMLMAAMALGMGAPLVALGFGAGALLPKAGAWMERVNHAFGVMLIAVAIYLLGALPEVPVLLLWGAFFIVVSVFMGATQSLPAGASGWRRLLKGAGLVLLVWGIAALVGGFFGQRDVFRPLPSALFAPADYSDLSGYSGAQDSAPAPTFIPVANLAQLDRHLNRAAAAGKPALLEYYADWCVDCARMEQTTFRDPRVAAILRRDFVALRADVTDPRAPGGKALKRRFSVFGPPAVLFFGRDGAPLADKHFYGYLGADEFLALLASL